MSNDLRQFIWGAMIGRIFGWWGCLVPLLLLVVAFVALAIFGMLLETSDRTHKTTTTTEHHGASGNHHQ
jgi:uncharacterized membrane protein